MRHNKISTVVLETSIVYTVKQGTWNLVRVSDINTYFIDVAVNLDRAMSNFYFDNSWMGIHERSNDAWTNTHCSMTSFGGMF
jgi:hypothetical protein